MWKKDPAYPALALPDALDKLARLLDTFETSDLNVSKALDCLGYKPRSRDGARLIEALECYGLIRFLDSGSRQRIRIGRIATRDYFSAYASKEMRDAAVQRLSLTPAIYQVMWERWGYALNNDSELENFLTEDLGYSPRATAALLRDYRATIEFARAHGLTAASQISASSGIERDGERLESGYPPSNRHREKSDDTHTDFDIEEDIDIFLEPGTPDPASLSESGDAQRNRPERDTEARVSTRQSRSTAQSVYGVTMLEEIARFQVSSKRKVYLMADGPLDRGDFESLLAQLNLKLEIDDIDGNDRS